MIDLIIKTENAKVAWAVELFFDNYKDQVGQFVNNVLKNEVGASDAYVDKVDGIFTVYQTAPDKGSVLAEVRTNVVELTQYSTLEPGIKYVLYDGKGLALFVKEPDGSPDLKVGHFLSLNDVVKEINSESVKTNIATMFAAKANADKETKKLESKIARRKLTKSPVASND